MSDKEQSRLTDLPVAQLNPDSPIPLYYQIEEDLRRLIQNGDIESEAMLPPEIVLSKAYNVGRHTMRMALARLASDGLILRRAGRGTIIKPPPDRTRFLLDRSFTQQMADLGRQARAEVLSMHEAVITADSPPVFAEHIGERCLHLDRLRFGDDEPIGIQSSIILTRHCHDLQRHDFVRSGLYDILARQYELIITRIQHVITATIAKPKMAEHLQMAIGDPLVVVNTSAFIQNDQLIEYTTSLYRADRYEYSTTHTISI